MKFLEDQNGNLSSKRVVGAIGFLVGLLLLAFTGVFSIFKTPAAASTAIECFKTILYVSGGLIGVGVFEFFGVKK